MLIGKAQSLRRRCAHGATFKKSLVSMVAVALLLSLMPASALAATSPTVFEDSVQPGGGTEGFDQAPEVPAGATPSYDPAEDIGPPPAEVAQRAAEGFEPGREIIERRTATSETLTGRVPGELETRVYPQPVHYRSGERWEKIDSTIEAVADDKRQSRANSFVARLSEQADDASLAELEIDAEHSVAFGLKGAPQTEGRVRSRFIDYSSVAQDTDLRLISTNAGIKEEIILHSPEAPHRFVFPLKLKGLSAAIDEHGDVVYTDSKGKELARTPAGYMYDSATDPLSDEPAYSDGVAYNLIREGGQVALEVVLDSAWILAKERVWPIVADPQVLRGAWPDDTYVMSPYNNNYSMDTELKVGTFNGGANKARSFMHFDTGGLHGSVTSAELQMREMHSYSCSAPPEAIFRVNQGWEGSTMRTFPGASYDPSGTLGWWVSGSCGSRLAAWNVTGMVQHFQNTGETMGSFAAVATQETNSYQWKKYRSTQAGNGPVLKIYTAPAVPTVLSPAYGQNVAGPTMGLTARHNGPGSAQLAFGLWDLSDNLVWAQWSNWVSAGQNVTITTSGLPEAWYDFRVAAYDGQVASAFTPAGHYVFNDQHVPTKPTGLSPAAGATVGTTFTASARYAEYWGWPGRIYFNIHNTAGAFVKQAVTPEVASGQTASVSVSLPAGGYDIYAYGYDGAQQLSARAGPHRITVAAAPGAPTGVQADPGPESALVRWSPPGSNGGSPITGYSVTAYNGTDPGAAAITKPCGTGCSPSGGFAFADLTPGHSYTFKVKATNAFGTGPLSSASPAVTVHATSSYADQVVAVAGDRSVQLSWEAQFLATSYIIKTYKGERPASGVTDPAHFVSEETVDVADTTHLIEGLLNGSTYYFTVTPVVLLLLVGQPSATSNPVVPFGVPFGPGSLAAVPDNGSLAVYWDPPPMQGDGTPGNNGSPITGYLVELIDHETGEITRSSEALADQGMESIDGLENGVQYTAQVRSRNAAGLGAASLATDTLAPGGTPFAPENVDAADGGPGTLQVSWQPPVTQADGTPGDNGSPIQGYEVVLSPGCPDCVGTAVDSSVLTTTVEGLPSGDYSISVRALNLFGRGQTSSPVGPVSVAGNAAQAPEPPTEVLAEWTGPTTVRVSWNAAEDNGSPITGYVALASPGAREVESSSFHADFGALDSTESYVFRVKSKNAIGESAPSNSAIVASYADPPVAPTNLVGKTRRGVPAVDLEWAPSGPTGTSATTNYIVKVFRSNNDPSLGQEPSPEFAFELIDTIDLGLNTTATVGTPTGYKYYFTVAAENSGGQADSSPTNKFGPVSTAGVRDLVYEAALAEFQAARGAGPRELRELVDQVPPFPPYPYSFESDGCSIPDWFPEWTKAYNPVFLDACQRHDFAYQNLGRRLHLGSNSAFERSDIDHQFKLDLDEICSSRPDDEYCAAAADVYWGSVRVGAFDGYFDYFGDETWAHQLDLQPGTATCDYTQDIQCVG